jgi:3-hydroxybutyryl-CoA dehydrogenase
VGAKALIGVIGAGTMGAGIAQLALEHGHEVILYDVDEAAIARGRDRIAHGLTTRQVDDLDGLHDAPSIEDVALEADWIFEAASEDLALKQTIFRTLDAAARPQAGLVTTTGTLPVAAIAEGTIHPQRILGLHFVQPVPLAALVEVVATSSTRPALADAAAALVESWGMAAVRTPDRPALIVDRAQPAAGLGD